MKIADAQNGSRSEKKMTSLNDILNEPDDLSDFGGTSKPKKNNFDDIFATKNPAANAGISAAGTDKGGSITAGAPSGGGIGSGAGTATGAGVITGSGAATSSIGGGNQDTGTFDFLSNTKPASQSAISNSGFDDIFAKPQAAKPKKASIDFDDLFGKSGNTPKKTETPKGIDDIFGKTPDKKIPDNKNGDIFGENNPKKTDDIFAKSQPKAEKPKTDFLENRSMEKSPQKTDFFANGTLDKTLQSQTKATTVVQPLVTSVVQPPATTPGIQPLTERDSFSDIFGPKPKPSTDFLDSKSSSVSNTKSAIPSGSAISSASNVMKNEIAEKQKRDSFSDFLKPTIPKNNDLDSMFAPKPSLPEANHPSTASSATVNPSASSNSSACNNPPVITESSKDDLRKQQEYAKPNQKMSQNASSLAVRGSSTGQPLSPEPALQSFSTQPRANGGPELQSEKEEALKTRVETDIFASFDGKRHSADGAELAELAGKSDASKELALVNNEEQQDTKEQFVYERDFWENPEEWCFFHENSYASSSFQIDGPTRAPKRTVNETLDALIEQGITISSEDYVRTQLTQVADIGSFVCSCANNATGLVCFGTSRSIIVLHDAKRKTSGVLYRPPPANSEEEEPLPPPSSMAFSSDGSMMVVGHNNGYVTLWSIPEKKVKALVQDLPQTPLIEKARHAFSQCGVLAAKPENQAMMKNRTIVSVGFRPSSRSHAIVADCYGTIYLCSFQAVFSSVHVDFLMLLDSNPEIGVCLKCCPLEKMSVLVASNVARDPPQAEADAAAAAVEDPSQIDNCALMLIVTTHAIVLMKMAPRIHILQRTVLTDEMGPSTQQSLPDACWCRSIGVADGTYDNNSEMEKSGGTLRKVLKPAKQRGRKGDGNGALLVVTFMDMIHIYATEYGPRNSEDAEADRKFWQLVLIKKLLFPERLYSVLCISSSVIGVLDRQLRFHTLQVKHSLLNAQPGGARRRLSTGSGRMQAPHHADEETVADYDKYFKILRTEDYAQERLHFHAHSQVPELFADLSGCNRMHEEKKRKKKKKIIRTVDEDGEVDEQNAEDGDDQRDDQLDHQDSATTDIQSSRGARSTVVASTRGSVRSSTVDTIENNIAIIRDARHIAGLEGGARCFHQSFVCLSGLRRYHPSENIEFVPDSENDDDFLDMTNSAYNAAAQLKEKEEEAQKKNANQTSPPKIANGDVQIPKGDGDGQKPEESGEGDGTKPTEGTPADSGDEDGITDSLMQGDVRGLFSKTWGGMLNVTRKGVDMTVQGTRATMDMSVKATQNVVSTAVDISKTAATATVDISKTAVNATVQGVRDIANTSENMISRNSQPPTSKKKRGASLNCNRPIFFCTAVGYAKIEVTCWLVLIETFVSQGKWEEALRIFLQIFDGSLTPLLDFPMEEIQRKRIVKQHLLRFVQLFVDYKTSIYSQNGGSPRNSAVQNGMEVAQPPRSNSPTLRSPKMSRTENTPVRLYVLHREVASAIEICIGICLKCDMYEELYKYFFQRLEDQERVYFLECLESWLLMPDVVKELDAEIYSFILQSYATRLSLEEKTALKQTEVLLAKTRKQRNESEDTLSFVGIADLREFAAKDGAIAMNGTTAQRKSDTQSKSSMTNSDSVEEKKKASSNAKLFTIVAQKMDNNDKTQIIETSNFGPSALRLPFHLLHDMHLNFEMVHDDVDFLPIAYPSALHLTRLIISRNDVFHLDLNLAIRVLSQYRLYGGLIYIHISCQNFVSPLEVLMGECARIMRMKFPSTDLDHAVLVDYARNTMCFLLSKENESPNSSNPSSAVANGITSSGNPTISTLKSLKDTRMLLRSLCGFLDEPVLSQVLLARKLFHYMSATFAGNMFLAGLPPPDPMVAIPMILKMLFKRADPRQAPKEFLRLLHLSPFLLFRSLSLLYTSRSGLFNRTGHVDASKVSVEEEARDLISPLGLLAAVNATMHQVLNDGENEFTIGSADDEIKRGGGAPGVDAKIEAIAKNFHVTKNTGVSETVLQEFNGFWSTLSPIQRQAWFRKYVRQRRRRHVVRCYRWFMMRALAYGLRVPHSLHWQAIFNLVTEINYPKTETTSLVIQDVFFLYASVDGIRQKKVPKNAHLLCASACTHIGTIDDAEELCLSVLRKMATLENDIAPDGSRRETFRMDGEEDAAQVEKLMQMAEEADLLKVQSMLHELSGNFKNAIAARLRLLEDPQEDRSQVFEYCHALIDRENMTLDLLSTFLPEFFTINQERTCTLCLHAGRRFSFNDVAGKLKTCPLLQIAYLEKMFFEHSWLDKDDRSNFFNAYLVRFITLLCELEGSRVLDVVQQHEAMLNLEETLAVCMRHKALDPSRYLLEKAGDFPAANQVFVEQFELAVQKLQETKQDGEESDLCKSLISDAHGYCGRVESLISTEQMEFLWFQFFDKTFMAIKRHSANSTFISVLENILGDVIQKGFLAYLTVNCSLERLAETYRDETLRYVKEPIRSICSGIIFQQELLGDAVAISGLDIMENLVGYRGVHRRPISSEFMQIVDDKIILNAGHH